MPATILNVYFSNKRLILCSKVKKTESVVTQFVGLFVTP